MILLPLGTNSSCTANSKAPIQAFVEGLSLGVVLIEVRVFLFSWGFEYTFDTGTVVLT